MIRRLIDRRRLTARTVPGLTARRSVLDRAFPLEQCDEARGDEWLHGTAIGAGTFEFQAQRMVERRVMDDEGEVA